MAFETVASPERISTETRSYRQFVLKMLSPDAYIWPPSNWQSCIASGKDASPPESSSANNWPSPPKTAHFVKRKLAVFVVPSADMAITESVQFVEIQFVLACSCTVL